MSPHRDKHKNQKLIAKVCLSVVTFFFPTRKSFAYVLIYVIFFSLLLENDGVYREHMFYIKIVALLYDSLHGKYYL